MKKTLDNLQKCGYGSIVRECFETSGKSKKIVKQFSLTVKDLVKPMHTNILI